MTRSREVILPHALAQHLSWAGDEGNQLPISHVESGGVTNKINLILMDRAIDGLDTYGTYLMANNERDATKDLIDEIADAIMYVTQLRIEDRGSLDDERAARIQSRLFEIMHMIVPHWKPELSAFNVNKERYVEYVNGDHDG